MSIVPPAENGKGTSPRDVRASSYVRLDDGTVWPDPSDPNEVQWRLRHGTPGKIDLLVAASTMSAYRELVLQTQKRRAHVVRSLVARIRSNRGIV